MNFNFTVILLVISNASSKRTHLLEIHLTYKLEIYFPPIICVIISVCGAGRLCIHKTSVCKRQDRPSCSIDLVSMHESGEHHLASAASTGIAIIPVPSKSRNEEGNNTWKSLICVIYSTVITLRLLIGTERRMLREIKRAAQREKRGGGEGGREEGMEVHARKARQSAPCEVAWPKLKVSLRGL